MQRPGPGAGLRKGLGEMKNKKTKKKEKKVNNRRPSRRNLIYQKRVALKLVALGQKAKRKNNTKVNVTMASLVPIVLLLKKCYRAIERKKTKN